MTKAELAKKFKEFIEVYKQDGMLLKRALRECKFQYLEFYSCREKLPELFKKYVRISNKKKNDKRFAKGLIELKDFYICEFCGKRVEFEEYYEEHKTDKNKSEGYHRSNFSRKVTCSKECELKRRYGKSYVAKSHNSLHQAITFEEYIMGELAHMYSDRYTTEHRFIEIFSDDTGLPIEQIERILSCQEVLTPQVARKMNQAGIGFSVDVMIGLQQREVRV